MALLMMALAAGCNRAGAPQPRGGSVVSVALYQNDLNADGTLTPAAVERIDQRAEGAPALSVTFIQARLSDAGLEQLTKYPNLKAVEALGSPLTQAAVRRLQESRPGVAVRY